MELRMPEINSVMLAGRLTRDPEVRYTQSQMAVASLGLAVNRRFQDKASGEWKDDTIFVSVTVWGQAAERCKEKMRKGTPLMVDGRITMSEYTDKAGQKRKELKITANRVQIMSFDGPAGEGAPKAAPADEAAEAEAKPGAEGGIEEVPF
ncbi:MAG: single-stranded DNA-binding protein [Elusimicrobiales bacterium]|nr:single-stranded DNA-binding protein [Elusimicrobiales bacterium]